jgi:hypothetical protein
MSTNLDCKTEEQKYIEKLVNELPDKSVSVLFYKLQSSCAHLKHMMTEVIKLTRQLQETCPHPEVIKYIAIDDHSPPTCYYCKVCQLNSQMIDLTKSKIVQEIHY